MTLKNKILLSLARRVIERNEKFKGAHAGESCYVFGNGASLKYFDLAKFNDKVSISCGPLFLHKDFNKLNVKYHYEGHPFFYYPFWVNPYSKKIERNTYGALYRKGILLNENISHFLSLSNYFGIRANNIYYVHHFDAPFNGFDNCRLDDNFTAMASSLSGMIGVAIYMGFREITLVGCDYSFFPQSQGHFYEVGKFPDTLSEMPANEGFLRAAADKVALRTVVPTESYRGQILPSISYEELTGGKPVYRENNVILAKEDLLVLSNSGMRYEIFR